MCITNVILLYASRMDPSYMDEMKSLDSLKYQMARIRSLYYSGVIFSMGVYIWEILRNIF